MNLKSFELFLKSFQIPGILNKKFLDCSFKSWSIAILCMVLLFFILGCENVRQSIGITTKPFQSGEQFENSTKLNYKIIFGKVRPKEDDD